MDAIWRLDIASGQAITKAPELAGRPGTCDLRIQSGLGSPFSCRRADLRGGLVVGWSVLLLVCR